MRGEDGTIRGTVKVKGTLGRSSKRTYIADAFSCKVCYKIKGTMRAIFRNTLQEPKVTFASMET